MADIQKFLDKTGVSTLWTQVANKIATDVAAEETRAKAAEKTLTDNLASEVTRAKAAEAENASAIAVLKGDSSTVGSVAYQIAQIVVSNDGAVDTLEEIAAWIAAHPDSVTALNKAITDEATRAKAAEEANASAISDLEDLVGSTSVATQIANAIANAGHASATELASAVSRIAAIETWKTQVSNTTTGENARLITPNEIAKLAKLVMDDDGSVSMSGTISADNVSGLSTAIDNRIVNQVIALTEAEIKSAIGVE